MATPSEGVRRVRVGCLLAPSRGGVLPRVRSDQLVHALPNENFSSDRVALAAPKRQLVSFVCAPRPHPVDAIPLQHGAIGKTGALPQDIQDSTAVEVRPRESQQN